MSLSPYLGDDHYPAMPGSTANYRGHIASWEIRNGDLLLVKLRGWIAADPVDVDDPMKTGLQEDMKAMPGEWKCKIREFVAYAEGVWEEVLWEPRCR
jgi:hypothetical protein